MVFRTNLFGIPSWINSIDWSSTNWSLVNNFFWQECLKSFFLWISILQDKRGFFRSEINDFFQMQFLQERKIELVGHSRPIKVICNTTKVNWWNHQFSAQNCYYPTKIRHQQNAKRTSTKDWFFWKGIVRIHTKGNREGKAFR